MFGFNLSQLLAPNFLLFLLLLQTSIPILVQSRNLKPTDQYSTNFLQNLEGIQKGQTNKVLIELKQYLVRFGYLNYGDHDNSNINLSDEFDEKLEFGLKEYQKFNNLDINGKLDANTIKQMLIPRCGVPDIFHQKPSKHNNSTTSFRSNYSFFPRMQKWRPFKTHLTYSIHPVPKGFGIDRVRNACASAFQKWSAVSKFTFLEGSEGKKTDIAIGFYRGRHGDGHPFDGPGHILSHAFAPEDGRFHYDADEKWSDNPGRDEFDLESLALHEIGHLLGLEHSHDPGSVMVPSIGAGVTRRKLGQDDINGIRALYSG